MSGIGKGTVDAKTKRMIISYARRISSSWPPRRSAKEKAKVAPALHRCTKCGILCYEGESVKTFQKYLSQYGTDNKVLFDGIEMDHISPVVQIGGWTSWDDYFKSLFCDEDNFRALCPPCHSDKTDRENSHREGYKAKRKKK
jgi:5-methylcytosine-specific restriction endonuclease McrA